MLSFLAGAVVLTFVFAALAGGFLLVLGWKAVAAWRQRLLWRLRNRLIVTYVLFGFIPVVLLALMGVIAGWTLYGKVAIYQVTTELERAQAELADVTSDVASAVSMAAALAGDLRPEVQARLLDAHKAMLEEHLRDAEISVVEASGTELPAWLQNQRFAGVVIGERAELLATRPVRVAGRPRTVVARLPLNENVLAYLGREVGPVSVQTLSDDSGPGAARRPSYVGTRTYFVQSETVGRRSLPPPEGWWDVSLALAGTQPTHVWETGQEGPPLVLFVQSRLSAVHAQLSYGLGEFSGVPFTVFTAFAVLFLLLEFVALRTGIRLTQTITATVNDLQEGTEKIQAGDFSHRIRTRSQDQLSGLASAFNSMTASIERLIAESQEKQRLQNELEIARQVQEQLFPSQAPQLATLEVVARCRPARIIGGDYFDFGLAGPGQLIFTIGDVSGKGISGALLMATIQSALRSAVYASQLDGSLARLSVAELVSRVNRQLCATTSPEKYSTLFIGYYDDASRRLTYCNAGHLPPVVFGSGRIEELNTGGPVVGLFREATYEQATVELRSGDWLAAFTDGLTEVENAYEEEFGTQRLLAFVQRTADGATPERLVELTLAELEVWAPGVEPSDDRTLLVARVR
ncbi:MAG TPA: SpoIIE family protein phosphatase [Candidatus Xenobia bacterium]|nr:SpoIIE family protein phosphatase [Candidatus Xenobia bacterium]